MDRFRVIVADPPWAYRNSSRTLNGTTERHYATMSADDLCALAVGEVATEDAVLLLWATFPQLPEALRVMQAWGFTYVTGLPWVKIEGIPGLDLGGIIETKPQYGVGFWLRGAAELLLLGRRPKTKPVRTNYVGVLGQNFRHSRKPASVYELAERFGEPRLELFARYPREGWTMAGHEVDGMTDIRLRLGDIYAGTSKL